MFTRVSDSDERAALVATKTSPDSAVEDQVAKAFLAILRDFLKDADRKARFGEDGAVIAFAKGEGEFVALSAHPEYEKLSVPHQEAFCALISAGMRNITKRFSQVPIFGYPTFQVADRGDDVVVDATAGTIALPEGSGSSYADLRAAMLKVMKPAVERSEVKEDEADEEDEDGLVLLPGAAAASAGKVHTDEDGEDEEAPELPIVALAKRLVAENVISVTDDGEPILGMLDGEGRFRLAQAAEINLSPLSTIIFYGGPVGAIGTAYTYATAVNAFFLLKELLSAIPAGIVAGYFSLIAGLVNIDQVAGPGTQREAEAMTIDGFIWTMLLTYFLTANGTMPAGSVVGATDQLVGAESGGIAAHARDEFASIFTHAESTWVMFAFTAFLTMGLQSKLGMFRDQLLSWGDFPEVKLRLVRRAVSQMRTDEDYRYLEDSIAEAFDRHPDDRDRLICELYDRLVKWQYNIHKMDPDETSACARTGIAAGRWGMVGAAFLVTWVLGAGVGEENVELFQQGFPASLGLPGVGHLADLQATSAPVGETLATLMLDKDGTVPWNTIVSIVLFSAAYNDIAMQGLTTLGELLGITRLMACLQGKAETLFPNGICSRETGVGVLTAVSLLGTLVVAVGGALKGGTPFAALAVLAAVVAEINSPAVATSVRGALEALCCTGRRRAAVEDRGPAGRDYSALSRGRTGGTPAVPSAHVSAALAAESATVVSTDGMEQRTRRANLAGTPAALGLVDRVLDRVTDKKVAAEREDARVGCRSRVANALGCETSTSASEARAFSATAKARGVEDDLKVSNVGWLVGSAVSYASAGFCTPGYMRRYYNACDTMAGSAPGE